MAIDQDACYEAFRSKDARFDGKFFVGVASTGIYCRSVCHAKLPKRENCTFFETAAEAEAAGYRPCLQCRPESAPGTAPVDSERALAKRAARLLKENCVSSFDMEAFAGRLGYTARHVRRVFADEFGVSPTRYLQTCRLLLAKQLLQSTTLPIEQVARAAGFGSRRQFNTVFKKHYGLIPSSMRRGRADGTLGSAIDLELSYRPPFAWERLFEFLSMRAIPGVESVADGSYWRTARIPSFHGEDVTGWIAVRPDAENDRAIVTVSTSLLDVLPQVIGRVRHQFDLDCDPASIACGLADFAACFPHQFFEGTRLPGCFDAFEMCVRAILGQQISVKGASTLAGRVAASLGRELGEDANAPVEGLLFTFPSAADVARLGEEGAERLRALGIVQARCRTICSLARQLDKGELDLSYGADPAAAIDALEALPGIGPWTAQYIAMRATGYPDAFPATDLGVKKALAPRTQREIEETAQNWRPWRSYATISLWSAPHGHNAGAVGPQSHETTKKG